MLKREGRGSEEVVNVEVVAVALAVLFFRVFCRKVVFVRLLYALRNHQQFLVANLKRQERTFIELVVVAIAVA